MAGDVPDPALVELEDESCARVDLNTASTESTYVPNHHDPLSVIVELERIDSKRLPVLVHISHELPDTVVSSINDALELRSQRQPLTVPGGQAYQPIDVTRVERYEGAAHDLHVLLRHAYSDSPTAARASSRLKYSRISMTFPCCNVTT